MNSPANVVLIGFMGSGKSSVGRVVAQRLGYRFVSTDWLVTREAGRDIPTLFAEEGEAGFRAREQQALQSLRGQSGLAIATGGGIVTVPGNVPLLRELGFVVWLTASEEVIWERFSRNDRRPLLRTEDPRATIRELLALRNPIYEEAAALEIDTTLLTHAEVAEKILAALP